MTAKETTDHAWVRENVATYLAGGLADDERVRFEAHVGACGTCLEDLQEAQGTEKSLAGVFANDHPSPWLEDGVIQSLRAVPAPRFQVSLKFKRIATAAAAVILLGLAGFFFEAGSAPKKSPVAAASPPRLQDSNFISHTEGKFLSASTQSSSHVVETQAQHVNPDYLYGATADGFTIRRSVSDMAKAKSNELLEELRRAEAGEWKTKENFRKSPAADPSQPAVQTFESGDQEERGKSSLKGDWYYKPGAEMQGVGGGAGGSGRFKSSETPPVSKPGQDKKSLDQDVTKNPAPQPQDPQASQRKIIRQGELEFEVDSFESSVDIVTRIAQEERGYVATVNSDRLPNGKVKGTIILRVPPESLDRLVLKLRGLGELKSQRITSEDITKKYYDLESRLKAARTMESRLIEIIRTGKGEIKDILAAEKELGEWREKIEIFEGEIRFYSNLVALSTLSLTLVEKDIRAPSLVNIVETVDTGIEAEDVLKAEKDLRKLIADAKGRITASDLKKLAADQFSLLIVCEVPPENAGPLRDRLTQLGRIARLDVKTQTSDNGAGRPLDGKVKQADTVFRISVYNTTNVQPRETSHLNLACVDVEAVFRQVVTRVDKAGGRVVQSNLNHLKADQVDGLVQFDVPVKEGEAVLDYLRDLGEVMSLKVIENPDSANVTKSKKGFHVVLLAMAHVTARETTTLRLAAKDVPETYRILHALVLDRKGRILDARLSEETRDRVTASLDVELPRSERSALDAALKAAGEILGQNVQRAPDDGRVVDSKIRVMISLQTIASVGPRRIVKLGVEVGDVDKASERLTKAVIDGGGQLVDSQNSRDPNGRAVSYLVFESRLNAMAGFVEQMRKAGTVRIEETRRNPSAPESELSIGRIELTLSNEDPIMGGDAGLGTQVKDALRSVVTAAGFSLKFILIGGLIVVPWVLIVWLGLKLVRRMRAKPAAGV